MCDVRASFTEFTANDELREYVALHRTWKINGVVLVR